MANMMQIDPLESLSFKQLQPSENPNILIYSPSPSNVSSSNPSPRVIILATWLGGATSARIAVYCRAYQALYPSTPILLIRSDLEDILTRSSAAVQRRLRPAQNYLLSIFEPSIHSGNGQQQGAALLHIFSHGGCNSALQLSRLMRSPNNRPFPIPLVGVILDSCPGSDSFAKDYNAATYSLPQSWPANLAGRALLLPLLGSMALLRSLRVVRFVDRLREELNEWATFGRVPRLYLHSAADHVVSPQDVASHAEALSEKGGEVRREVWARAMHSALPTEDAGRYWGAIEGFVKDGVGNRSLQARL